MTLVLSVNYTNGCYVFRNLSGGFCIYGKSQGVIYKFSNFLGIFPTSGQVRLT